VVLYPVLLVSRVIYDWDSPCAAPLPGHRSAANQILESLPACIDLPDYSCRSSTTVLNSSSTGYLAVQIYYDSKVCARTFTTVEDGYFVSKEIWFISVRERSETTDDIMGLEDHPISNIKDAPSWLV
jgi:hypothetical protein